MIIKAVKSYNKYTIQIFYPTKFSNKHGHGLIFSNKWSYSGLSAKANNINFNELPNSFKINSIRALFEQSNMTKMIDVLNKYEAKYGIK